MRIKVMRYSASAQQSHELGSIRECAPLMDGKSILWVDILNPTSADLKPLEKVFGFHPLALEDCLVPDQRPKVEAYEEYLFSIVKAVHIDEEEGVVEDQVGTFLGKDYVVTVHQRPLRQLEQVRYMILNKGKIVEMGPDFLLYRVVDTITDSYFPILQTSDDNLDDLEEKVLKDPDEKTLDEIHTEMRNLIWLRKVFRAQRTAFSQLERSDFPQITDDTKIYFRDVTDHMAQLIETLETLRDATQGILNTYMTSLSFKTNEVMKVLTIIATIFIPLTFITGIYGMNFATGLPGNMPELTTPYGYVMALGMMVGIALVMLAYFKKKKWL